MIILIDNYDSFTFNIYHYLSELGAKIKVYRNDKISIPKILKIKPKAIILSPGPCTPNEAGICLNLVKKLYQKFSILGICLGHQILSIALGGKTYKMKFGHRGCNHPVKNLVTGKVEISSHNHGFSVKEESLPSFVEVTHRSLNDNSVEGIKAEKLKAFSVQYHPESSPGPHDSRYLFNDFFKLIKKYKTDAKKK